MFTFNSIINYYKSKNFDDEVTFFYEIKKDEYAIINETLNIINEYIKSDSDDWISISQCISIKDNYPLFKYNSSFHRKILHLITEACGLILRFVLYKNLDVRLCEKKCKCCSEIISKYGTKEILITKNHEKCCDISKRQMGKKTYHSSTKKKY
jgi:hypothetical protein